MDIKTPAGTLQDGKRYDLALNHGGTERWLRGATVHAFKQDGEMRYEATGEMEDGRTMTVGFLADNVLEAANA